MTRKQILEKARDAYRKNLKESFPARFWARVKKGRQNECWPWNSGKDITGYGRVAVIGKPTATHRVAWELTNGPIPEGKWVLHKCDNPPCCNPAHLYIGTVVENVRDMIDRGRKKTFPGNKNGMWKTGGETHMLAKLTNAQVLEIRQRYGKAAASRWQPGMERQVDLADEFGVSQAVISSIIRYKHRRHG